MHQVLRNDRLSPIVHRLVLVAPRIAAKRQPGQFVMVRLGPGHERIPLTIADADPSAGTISLVIQAVGLSTRALVALQPGEAIRDIAGPLGRATDLIESGRAVCVGGGVGTAVVYPIAQALRARGVEVISVIGGRTAELVILREELSRLGSCRVCTDDGSLGHKGVVTEQVKNLMEAMSVQAVYAVGPVPMMRAVSDLTRSYGVHTIVSLNPIMIDGTGMCGGCRVSVGGQVRFACVDGPEFDAHGVDFNELWARLGTYKEQEAHVCRLKAAADAAGKQP